MPTATSERIAPPGYLRGRIEVRVPDLPSDEDMAQINRLARAPLRPEDVYVFDCVPSTDVLDSYYTRQAPSSLANYARDAVAGVAVMNSHRTNSFMGDIELPVGRSFYGEVQNQGSDLSRLFAKAYMLRGYQPNEKTPSTDILIQGLEAGVIFDLSIGFKPGWYRCGVCNRDLFDRDCPHYPGQKYDGARAFAWVEDAHMGEFSFVYDGATPGAGVLKAQRAYEAGMLDRKLVAELEDCYQVRLARRHNGLDLGQPAETTASEPVDRHDNIDKRPSQEGQEGGAMKGSELINLIIVGGERSGKTLSAATMEKLRAIQEKVLAAGDTCEEAATMMTSMMSESEGEAEADRATLTDLRMQINTLTPLAKLGERYKADLITETLAMGVRLYGNDFSHDSYKAILERADIDTIKQFSTDWDRLVRAKYGDGTRQTPAEDLGNPAVRQKAPTGQYKA